MDDDEAGQEVPILEKVGDPYVRLPQRTYSVPARVRLSSLTSVQVNVDAQGHNIVGDAANEPSLAVDPTNRNHIAVGWRQFDTVTSNFRQAGNGYSLDGGMSWNPHQVFTPGTFRSDPVLVPDANGTFYYNSLQQTFYTDVFTSTNAGLDYQLVGPAKGGDKQWMTCDRSKSIGRGFLYEHWSTAGNNYNGLQFSRSVDGGTTWMNPINIPGSPIWGTLDVAANGDLYLCGLSNGNFRFNRSVNARNASVTPTFDRSVTVNLGGAIIYGSTINPDGLMGQAWIACDKTNGPYAGNIYMVCSVGVDTANPCQVNFVRSSDGGLTWTTPRTLNTDTPNAGASHWFGTLAVAPSGRIDVCWFDNRANPAISNSALYITSSYDGGVTWTPEVQASPSFNPNIGYPNQNKMGDYLGMVSDGQGANIAYAATFNGEEDIWFLRVPDDIAMPTNATAIAPSPGKVTSGSLSDVWSPDGNSYTMLSASDRKFGNIAAAETYFVLPTTDVGSIKVKVRGTTTHSTRLIVWLWNWQKQIWEGKQTADWTGGSVNNTTITFGPGVNPYVYGNGTVRCLVQSVDPAGLTPSQFTVQYDQIQLLFG
ncbi:MAG: exo-alpha-sialidase [Armatimonadetes bacterium]|nr:exo-alpha-sialidase [Armatimonadota bacterium]